MSKVIMVGCDLHEQNLMTMTALGTGPAVKRTYRNTPSSLQTMIDTLLQQARRDGADRIVFAYESSCLGFGLYDLLDEAGIECHVVAPSRVNRSPRQRSNKTDERDTLDMLELLRGHVLAGNRMPTVWIPDRALRNDREVVRRRLEAGEGAAEIKTRIKMLLKRRCLRRSRQERSERAYRRWLTTLAEDESSPLSATGRLTLESLLRQLAFMEQEIQRLDHAILDLSLTERYAPAVKRLTARKGVGLLTAMVFLVEVGDPRRFANRRQLASFLGLSPTAHESGQVTDRKGHITRQGSSRVRKVLCQAVWSMIRCDAEIGGVYRRIAGRNPKARKKAVVAAMRHLAIWMWHRAVESCPEVQPAG